MTDSLKPTITVEQFLAKHGSEERPFVFKLGGNRGNIVFPDYNAGSVDEARQTEHRIQRAIDPMDAMKEWLPAEDYAKLEKLDLNARKIESLFAMAHAYVNGEKRARSQITRNALDAECPDPTPFSMISGDGKRIIFPDFATQSVEAVREFYETLRIHQHAPEIILRTWLDEKSYENLMALDLNARQLSNLCNDVVEHYMAAKGTPGESNAS